MKSGTRVLVFTMSSQTFLNSNICPIPTNISVRIVEVRHGLFEIQVAGTSIRRGKSICIEPLVYA
jgi:hypothetical protein